MMRIFKLTAESTAEDSRGYIDLCEICSRLCLRGAKMMRIFKLTGGELRTTSMDLVGPAAEKYLSDYHVDLLLTGCDGADTQEGFYTSDLNLASYEKLSVKISDKIFILTESTKFAHKALAKFAELKEINTLITDNNLKAIDQEILARQKIKIITTIT